MSETLSLSIIIPTYKRARQVIRLLNSIESQKDVPPFEVLVVSNFHDAKLELELRSFKTLMQIRPLIAHKKGVNASRNEGMRQSKGSVLLFLDDDCVLHKRDYLRLVLRAHSNFPDHQVIGGGYESAAGLTLEQQAYNFISSSWCEAYQHSLDQSWALLGGNVSYKSRVRDSGHEFNEDISYGGSETEFHLRLFENGLQMKYLPYLSVQHRPGVSAKQIFGKALRQAETASAYRFPEVRRAADLCKYIYTKRCSEAARTKAQFHRYLEIYRLHEDAFLNTEQYRRTWPRYKRLLGFHRKYFLC